MTVEKMAAIWDWFAAQWRPEVSLPRPVMRTRIMPSTGHCSLTTVSMSPWARRWSVLREYGLWMCYHGGEGSAAGRAFLAYLGEPRFDFQVRRLWARSVAGLLTGRWRGGNRAAAESAIRPLLADQTRGGP